MCAISPAVFASPVNLCLPQLCHAPCPLTRDGLTPVSEANAHLKPCRSRDGGPAGWLGAWLLLLVVVVRGGWTFHCYCRMHGPAPCTLGGTPGAMHRAWRLAWRCARSASTWLSPQRDPPRLRSCLETGGRRQPRCTSSAQTPPPQGAPERQTVAGVHADPLVCSRVLAVQSCRNTREQKKSGLVWRRKNLPPEESNPSHFLVTRPYRLASGVGASAWT